MRVCLFVYCCCFFFHTRKPNLRSRRKQHGGCELWQMNPSMGKRRTSPDHFCFIFLCGIRWRVLLFKKTKSHLSGSQILNNPCVWYSHNIPLMIKMSNLNITQRRTETSGLVVMIGRCSPDSQHGRIDRHLTNVCSFFSYTNDEPRNHTNQRRKAKHGFGKTVAEGIFVFGLACNLIRRIISPNQDDLSYSTRSPFGQQ